MDDNESGGGSPRVIAFVNNGGERTRPGREKEKKNSEREREKVERGRIDKQIMKMYV